MKGFIVYQSSATLEGQTYVKLFGRLENGRSFCSIHKLNPYLFIKESELKNVEKNLKNFIVKKTSLTDFDGNKVSKISSSTQTELNKLYHSIHRMTDTYEADVKPYFRFMIDNDLLGSIEIKGDFESSEKVDCVYSAAEISPSSFDPTLKVLSIDVESDKKTGKLFCIGLYSDNYKKNFIVSDRKIENSVSIATEEECLKKFKDEIIKFDPDIITGWNLVNFDLKYLQELFKKHDIPFDIGRTNENVSLRIEKNFFRPSSAEIAGRQVLDALDLIRDPFIKEAPSIKNAHFESYALEDVAQAILGKGKLIKGKKRHDEIERMYNNGEHDKLVEYNIQDCKLVYEILDKTKIIDLAVERSQLTGLTVDRLTSSIAAFDSLYIREARKKGLVSPTTHYGNKEARIKGGYVFSFKPGIYHNVLVLDFKSLYPSIIKTFNIDPSSKIERKEKGAIESPNKSYFKNQEGILPEILKKLHMEREKAKKEKRELANYAIKIIMNSFFGVLASPNCRYFNLGMANAITHFGQKIIKLTAEQIEKKGYKIIYMDTDSVFAESNLGKQEADLLGTELQDYINNFYRHYIKENYGRESFLELEFQKQYLSLLIPRIRGSGKESAAKKRYAGLIEEKGREKLDIVGLEAIRGDWTEAAQEFQRELLLKLFKKEPVESFIKGYVKKIKERKLDGQLIYRKSIRKELAEYTKTTPPHVKAARKLDSIESNIITYYITVAGPEPIQKLRHKIDYDHYIDKQIAPIANQILILLGKEFDDLIKNHTQSTLFLIH